MIVLTDGRSNPRPAGDAVASAARAGRGDHDLHDRPRRPRRRGAGRHRVDAAVVHPGRGRLALDAIYRDIAKTIPCPASAFWSAR
ncbi:MAG: hypothetical protein U0470_09440 [Anaerolineae bacterium]